MDYSSKISILEEKIAALERQIQELPDKIIDEILNQIKGSLAAL